MGDYSERLKARNSGQPYMIDSAAEFERQVNILLSRLQGNYGMWLGVSSVLARAQHRAQRTMDEIEEQQVAADEQPGEQEGGQDEDGKPAEPKVEYPH